MKKQYHKVIKGKVSRGTGAKKVKAADKRLRHVGNYPANTKLAGNEERKILRTKGGRTKVKLKRALYANVAGKDGKAKKVKILRVLESNTPTMARQGVVVKGAVVETEMGKARVTSRPGQDGVVNAKLI